MELGLLMKGAVVVGVYENWPDAVTARDARNASTAGHFVVITHAGTVLNSVEAGPTP